MADIYQYVLEQENEYQTGVGVRVAGNWMWRMYDHVNYSLLMKNSQFPVEQLALGDRPLKNIVRPILNVAYRSEGFDVKDIEAFVEDDKNYYKSLLARKFHGRWALKYGMDGFIDDVVETYCDYGGVLVKNVNEEKPEVVSFQSIAFCDQTDLLGGARAIKHQYSVSQLKDMIKQGWYEDEVNFAIEMAKAERTNNQQDKTKIKTPSKYIEVYEVHGSFPESWLKKGEEGYDSILDEQKYTEQIHIITYVKDEKDNKNGICLFKGKELESPFKVLLRDKIYGRALGFGGIEELFEPQIWSNFNLINMTNMLREASKVIHLTDDDKFTTRNNVTGLKGGEWLVGEENKRYEQVNNQPVSFNLFDRAFQEWEQHARTLGSASDPQLGLNPVSGTPLGTTQIVTNQGLGIHDYRRGKIASFIEEIYRDWIMKYLVNEMNKGDKWLDELELEELQEVADIVSIKNSNKKIKEMVLKGKTLTKQDADTMRELLKKEFVKGGKKKFIEIIKGEFKDLPLTVKINVAGKQKNAPQMVEKLFNVFRAIISNPQGFVQVMQIPAAARSFNQMLEYSGLSPMNYTQFEGIKTEIPVQEKPLAISK